MTAHIRFPISNKTENKITELLARMNNASELKPFSKELSVVVNELIDEGVDFYFLNNIKRLKINAIVRKPFEIGVHASMRGLKLVSPKIFRTLSEKQFKEVVVIMEELIEKE